MELFKVLEQFNKGKKIRRACWQRNSYVNKKDKYWFTISELNATDWEVYSGPKQLPDSRKDITDPIYVDIEVSEDSEGRKYKHFKYLTMSKSWIKLPSNTNFTYDPRDVTEMGHRWLEQNGVNFKDSFTCINILSDYHRGKLISDIREIM